MDDSSFEGRVNRAALGVFAQRQSAGTAEAEQRFARVMASARWPDPGVAPTFAGDFRPGVIGTQSDMSGQPAAIPYLGYLVAVVSND